MSREGEAVLRNWYTKFRSFFFLARLIAVLMINGGSFGMIISMIADKEIKESKKDFDDDKSDNVPFHS